MSNSNSLITPERAAELYAAVADPKTKWEFLDGVAAMIAASPDDSQREVIDRIGDTSTFIALHGHHRDGSDAGKKAKSRLKSIRDEVSVVKTWPASKRVDGVSFEAHKVLNRLGADAGGKILATLVKEMGGPGNVTKSAVANRLKVADPDHVPQSNGKAKARQQALASGNQGVTTSVNDFDAIELSEALAKKLTVGELGKDKQLAMSVKQVVDIYEAFDSRNAAKAKATAGKSKSSAPARKRAAATSTPAKPKRSAPAVKTPKVKTPKV